MNKDQIKGRTEEVSGKTKAAVGKVLKDGKLVNKGRAEEVASKGAPRHLWRRARNEVNKEVKKEVKKDTSSN